MSITIKGRWDGKPLYVAENASDVRAALQEAVRRGADLRSAYLRSADLRSADLSGADLRSADLRSAYLRSADLRSADLRSADLSGAYLRSADLSGADLRSAYLSGAKGIAPELHNDLLMLLDQVGKIRAYKLVNAKGVGPFNGGITYKIGETYEVKNANADPANDCGAGINVATLPWCLREWRSGYRVLVVEFSRKDIACIPHGSDGKFRLHRCRVVAEKKVDPVALGLVAASEQPATAVEAA